MQAVAALAISPQPDRVRSELSGYVAVAGGELRRFLLE
jgi:hypothetical protein